MDLLYHKSKPTKKKMKINLIVCCDKDGGIGKNGGLPWSSHFDQDMRNFMNLTKGNGVLMGRKTWESLPERHRPLKGRRNYVISNTLTFEDIGPHVSVYPGVDVAVAGAALDGVRELWVIGGEKIYSDVMQRPDLLGDVWVTIVDKVYECDAKFPLNLLKVAFPEGPNVSIPYKTKDGIGYTINTFS